MSTLKKKEQAQDKPVLYGVIVELEHPGVLADEASIKNATSGQLTGELYLVGMAFAESGSDVNSLAHCIRRLALANKSDFEPFMKAMMTINGVTGVKKDTGPWTRTRAEKRAEEKERKRIAKEKKRLAEKDAKERTRKLEKLKMHETKEEQSDNETYGSPGPAARLDRPQFEEFLSSIDNGKVEARVIFSDILAGGFLGYERVVDKLSGDKISAFFEQTMNGDLRAPLQPKIAFYDIPFMVEYRERDGKKFAHLTVQGGNPNFIMTCHELFVRA